MTLHDFVLSVARVNGLSDGTYQAVHFEGPGWWGVFIRPTEGEYRMVAMLWDEAQDLVIKGAFYRRGA